MKRTLYVHPIDPVGLREIIISSQICNHFGDARGHVLASDCVIQS